MVGPPNYWVEGFHAMNYKTISDLFVRLWSVFGANIPPNRFFQISRALA